jgi:hypothetical protein
MQMDRVSYLYHMLYVLFYIIAIFYDITVIGHL